jgi:hypothetical protein
MYLKSMEGKAAFLRLKTRKSIITETVANWDLTFPFSMVRLEKQSQQLDSAILSIGNKQIKLFHILKSINR